MAVTLTGIVDRELRDDMARAEPRRRGVPRRVRSANPPMMSMKHPDSNTPIRLRAAGASRRSGCTVGSTAARPDRAMMRYP